jgi:2-polyprenyl-3-methyl-5-hydroxy-6-metoxy-1,4-benzoquinol methylase
MGILDAPVLTVNGRKRRLAMRLALRGESLVERLALLAGLVPTPAAHAWGGMALAGAMVSGAELGLYARLARGPASPAELAVELNLDQSGVELVLECLRAAGHVVRRGGRYRLRRRSRRWLDPASDLSVTRFVAANADYWQWWAALPEVARTGRPVGHHAAAADDPYWDRYIAGQLELARLSAGEVARKVPVPRGPRRLLDVGGGHGWYSAALCRRHPGLSATVLDLPGSARVGRRLIAAAGMADRVGYREGGVLEADLGGPYDVVLCFNLVHHFGPAEAGELFRRIRGAIAPDGCLAVMDAFAEPSRRRSGSAATLGLFMYLSSGSAVYRPTQLREWLAGAGFAPPRRIPVRRIPGQGLYLTRPSTRASRGDPG